MESITSIPNRRNNTIDLTTSNTTDHCLITAI